MGQSLVKLYAVIMLYYTFSGMYSRGGSTYSRRAIHVLHWQMAVAALQHVQTVQYDVGSTAVKDSHSSTAAAIQLPGTLQWCAISPRFP
jgi:hypothetical protein